MQRKTRTILPAKRSTAYDIVKAAVDTKLGKFTKKEITNICPSISEKSVEASLKKLVDESYVEKHGSGKGTFYSKSYVGCSDPGDPGDGMGIP